MLNNKDKRGGVTQIVSNCFNPFIWEFIGGSVENFNEDSMRLIK